MPKSREMSFDPTKTIEDITPPKFEIDEDTQKDRTAERLKTETKIDKEFDLQGNIEEVTDQIINILGESYIKKGLPLDKLHDQKELITQEIITEIEKRHPDVMTQDEINALDIKAYNIARSDESDTKLPPEIHEMMEEAAAATEALYTLKTRTRSRISGILGERIDAYVDEKNTPEVQKRVTSESVKRKLAEMKIKKQEKADQQKQADRQKIDALKEKLGIKKRRTDEQPTVENEKAA